jgi:integrase/recombinase XerD
MTTTKKIPKMKAEEIENVKKIENSFLDYLKAQVSTNISSLYEYQHVIRQFLEYLTKHQKNPKRITQDEINGFMVELKAKYGNNSMIPKTAGLRHYVRYLGMNPEKGGNIKIEMPRSKQTRKGCVLTQEEIIEFFDATKDNPLANAVIKVAYYCGLRRMELVNLDKGDVDFENKILTVRNGKGVQGEPEKIAISEIALQSIQRYLTDVRNKITPMAGSENALFLCSTNNRVSKTALHMLVKEAQVKTNITKTVYLHMFRASILTHMHNNGADVIHIKELSRHKDLKSIEVYIRSSDKQKKENYDRYVPKLTETDTPIPPTPPEKPQKPKEDVMVAETKQVSVDVSRKQELLSLLHDGLITPQFFRECMTKQDNLMFG